MTTWFLLVLSRRPKEPFWSMTQSSPIVKSIASRLREAIHTGRFPVGTAVPAERDLAAEFRVSRTAVRQALEQLASELVLEVKPRCRPVVSSFSELIRSQDRTDVGVWLWPNTTACASSQLLAGIQSVFTHEHDHRLVIGSANGDGWEAMWESEERFLRSIASDPKMAGAILWYLGGAHHRRELDRARDAGIHLVFVDRYPDPNYSADYVGTDNVGSAELVVRHLIDAGHRKIACLSNLDGASSVLERIEGWRVALAREGIIPEPSWLEKLDEVGTDREQITGPLRRLLEDPNPPTAIFCINDLVALTAYDILESWGIDIPGDLSLAGFDGVMAWLPNRGNLTTAVQDFRRMGEVSARLVLDRISGKAHRPHRHTMLSAPLLVSESSGPAPRLNHPLPSPHSEAITS
jgi:LacI family transcriptional regulator